MASHCSRDKEERPKHTPVTLPPGLLLPVAQGSLPATLSLALAFLQFPDHAMRPLSPRPEHMLLPLPGLLPAPLTAPAAELELILPVPAHESFPRGTQSKLESLLSGLT